MFEILISILFAAAVILFWIMLYDGNRFVIVKHTLCDERIEKAYRAVVLSDLHNKRFGRNNERLLQAIEEQKPDGIWITGDMLTARPGESMQVAIDLVTVLADRYPVYYANGNHEHRMKLYPETYGNMAQEYGKALKKAGIEPLVNRNELLEEQNIVIYGSEIDKYYYKRFTIPEMDEGYMTELLGEPDPQKYNVLLAHNPDYFPAYAKWGADLVLSGHVHGGMIRIPGWRGILSPNVRFFPPYDGGLFTEGKSRMILSRGLGMHTLPVRLFNPAEVIVIDLKKIP